MFWTVTLRLLDGFKTTCAIFGLTLLISLPLGLVIAFGSMSKFIPLRWLSKTFVWIIRGVPLMLQLFIVFYVPGFLLGAPVSSRFNAVIIAFSI
ncbi:MAG: ABC transporter permease subunit, partial [Clostridia bacterium]|nr:ABC transporter permease subunit [Clostridia bacterium]